MSSLNGNVLKNIRALSIKNRLILFFILVSCIPVAIVGIVSYSYTKNSIATQASETVGELLLEITMGLDKEFSQIEIISLEMASDKYMKRTLEEYKPNNELEALSKKNTIFSEYIQQKINNRRLINNVIIYSRNGYAFSFGKIPDQATVDFESFDVYKAALEKNGKPKWIETHTYEGTYNGNKYGNILSIVRSVRKQNSDDYIGVVEIQLNEKLLRGSFKDISSDKVGVLFIADSNGEIISSLQKDSVERVLDFNNKSLLNGESGAFITKVNDVESLVTYRNMQTTNWKVISVQPYSKLFANAWKVGAITLVISLVGLAVAVLISILLSSSIVNPIKKIIYFMDKAENGNLNLKLNNNSSDEIGQLTDKFNTMLEQINKLFNALVLEGKLKKEAEFSALQAQITPHFLYNTLNSIRCLAEISNQSQIGEMIRSLIILLQNSVNKVDEFITLKEEFELANHYVILQKIRYNHLFTVEYDLSDELIQYKTLKFIIQPLIENSIIHGFKSIRGDGKIRVSGRKENNMLVLEVADNGDGMMGEELARIFDNISGVRRSRFSGIGIANVNDRIKLFFGDNYGLYYESEPGKSTVARLTMPLFTGEYKKTDVAV